MSWGIAPTSVPHSGWRGATVSPRATGDRRLTRRDSADGSFGSRRRVASRPDHPTPSTSREGHIRTVNHHSPFDTGFDDFMRQSLLVEEHDDRVGGANCRIAGHDGLSPGKSTVIRSRIGANSREQRLAPSLIRVAQPRADDLAGFPVCDEGRSLTDKHLSTGHDIDVHFRASIVFPEKEMIFLDILCRDLQNRKPCGRLLKKVCVSADGFCFACSCVSRLRGPKADGGGAARWVRPGFRTAGRAALRPTGTNGG